MQKDLNRFQKKHTEIYQDFLNNLKTNEEKINNIEYIFPIFHGKDICSSNDYRINNIIEAREFINNKTLSKNIVEACNELLNLESIDEILDSNEKDKLQASLTLLDFVTQNDIKSLLLSKNYDEKIVEKEFTNKKEFTIFSSILDKIYNGEKDSETINLIESEINEYSNKETILKNIEQNDQKTAEDLLVKYSELGPIVTSTMDKQTINKKVEEFYKSLTEEESKIFNKFNINNKIFETKKTTKLNTGKLVTFIVACILLFGSIIFLTINKVLLTDNISIKEMMSNYAILKVDDKVIKSKVEETSSL